MVQRWPAVPMAAKAMPRKREIEIGGGRDDGGVVAAELEDRAGEALGELRADLTAHGGGAGGGEDRHTGVLDEDLADLAAAEQHLAEALRHAAEALGGALDDGVGGERGEQGLLGGLPHHAVAADEARAPRSTTTRRRGS